MQTIAYNDKKKSLSHLFVNEQ